MQNPLLWLAISLLLVAVSLTAVLAIAVPAIQELARAARSAERLLDMLRQELPPVLRSMQNTGQDLSQLSDQVNEGVRSASQVVKQVDQGIGNMRHQAATTRRMGLSFVAGMRAAWGQLSHSSPVESSTDHSSEPPLGQEGSQGYWVYEDEHDTITDVEPEGTPEIEPKVDPKAELETELKAQSEAKSLEQVQDHRGTTTL